MNRECSGCGSRSCEGECYHEVSEEAVEFWNNLRKLSEKYDAALRDADSTIGDPLKARAA